MNRYTPLVSIVMLGTTLAGTARAKPPEVVVAAKPKALGDTLSGRAKEDYEAARVLVGDGDYAGARIKFQAAYDASKDPRLLWNLAACEKSLRHYARAIELLKQFGVEGGTRITDKDRAEAAELVKTLDPFTVALTIEVNEADAEIEVDDTSVGKSPLPSSVVVDIGQRRVRARKTGFRDSVVTSPVGGSAQQVVTLKLDREVHEGKLAVQAPTGAVLLIDGQPMGYGKGAEPVEVVLASGGHTLRVTAPGMRVYEREVVLKDNETRSVEILLERELGPQLPPLRVAVGCVHDVPRGTDDGLAVYLDGSPTAATATDGKISWRADVRRNVIEYVEYRTTSGRHDVLVRIPGCEPLEATIVVDAVRGGELRGSLPTSSGIGGRGPAGNPDWGRLALSAWLPGTLGDDYEGVQLAREAGPALEGLQYKVNAAGIMVQPGITLRWWTAMLDLGVAQGTASVGSQPRVATPDILSAVGSPDVKWLRAGVRSGVRFPLDLAAITLGVGGGYDNIVVDNLARGVGWDRPHELYLSAWLGLEAYVFCDWSVFGAFSADTHVVDDKRSTYGIQLGAAFQPNKRCRAERSPHRLTGPVAGLGGGR